MNSTARKIAEIAEALAPDAQARLLEVAEALSRARPSFCETMTAAQRIELERAIGEADRSEVVSEDELDREIDRLFASRA